MPLTRHTDRHAITGASLALALANPGLAQPARPGDTAVRPGGPGPARARPPLRVLIGFSQRSASDDLLRLLQPHLAATLGREIRIELMPGDLGAKAAREVVASPPDGDTLLVATFGTHAVNPNINPGLGYDPVRDFTPVCLATRSPLILGTRLSLDASDVAGLIALGSRMELTYGSSGVGSAPFLAALLFQKKTGITMRHRPYPDTRVLYEDLQAGRLDLSFNNASTMLPQVRDGRLRALAVTTARRSPALPGITTLAEAGLQDYALDNWLGLVAPPGTPADIVAVQGRAIVDALAKPAVAGTLKENGIETVGGTGAEFASCIASELARWAWLRPTPGAPPGPTCR